MGAPQNTPRISNHRDKPVSILASGTILLLNVNIYHGGHQSSTMQKKNWVIIDIEEKDTYKCKIQSLKKVSHENNLHIVAWNNKKNTFIYR